MYLTKSAVAASDFQQEQIGGDYLATTMFTKTLVKLFAPAAFLLSAITAEAAVFEIIALPDAENYIDAATGFPGIIHRTQANFGIQG